MLRKTTALFVLAGTLTGMLAANGAAAQSYGGPPPGQDSNYYGDDDDWDFGPGNPPPAGADVAYDYVNHEDYRYQGPAPQAPAAREQRGYRDGHIQREPLTGYYSGVRLVYPYSYYRHRCGCSGYGYGYGYSRYDYGRHRHYERDRYVGDDLDTQDYGRFSYNYSTRRYTDHHFNRDGWLW